MLAVQACGTSQNPGTTTADGPSMKKGMVIQKIQCVNDTAVSYSLYLPKSYSEKSKNPVIIAFDPHGAGSLPVERYKDLAERYQTILIGSNDSRNGLPLNKTQQIVQALFDEIPGRYSIDTNQIYVTGFSGGARVASLVALYRGGIMGLIGCGAGLAGSDQPSAYRFDYIGFAGNEDFNMNEMISLDEQLEQANFRHDLVIFDGKHEWPSSEVMEYAFLWNLFNHCRDNRISPDAVRIADFKALINQEMQEGVTENNLHRQTDALQRSIHFLRGLNPVEKEEARLAQLKNSDAWKKEEAKVLQVREKEMKEQRMYLENFYAKDLDWWKEQITDYELRITNGKEREDVLMCKRITSYLSLLAYMNYSGAKTSGNTERTQFSLNVYRIVDPENAAKIK